MTIIEKDVVTEHRLRQLGEHMSQHGLSGLSDDDLNFLADHASAAYQAQHMPDQLPDNYHMETINESACTF